VQNNPRNWRRKRMRAPLSPIQLGGLAAILLFGLGIQLFNRRSGKETLSGLPVILKYDPWQTAPVLAAFLFSAGVVDYALRKLPQAFANHHESAGTVFSIMAMIVLLNLVFIGGIGWLFFKMISPDRVVMDADTIELYSLGRTRQWSWRQIADVELKTVRESRGGTHQVVCLHIPDEAKPTVALPRFLRSAEGPEDESTIYELIRNLLARAKAAKR